MVLPLRLLSVRQVALSWLLEAGTVQDKLNSKRQATPAQKQQFYSLYDGSNGLRN